MIFRKIKYQRKVNKAIADFNHILDTDDYLQHRFQVRQIQRSKDSGTYYFRFEIVDSGTNTKAESHWFEDYSFEREKLPYRLFNMFNNFIVEKLQKTEG